MDFFSRSRTEGPFWNILKEMITKLSSFVLHYFFTDMSWKLFAMTQAFMEQGKLQLDCSDNLRFYFQLFLVSPHLGEMY